jgi:NAD(P)H dehydrogenase (quinone)
MNIGIIVHSHTGHTRLAATKLQEALAAAGHTVSIHSVSAMNDAEADYQKVRLNERPDVSAFDALFFGAPVRGFSLSPVMKAYLSAIGPLDGKQIACFVTQSLPYPLLGGNRSVRQMRALCRKKGSDPFGTGVINWSKAEVREKQMEAMAGDLSKALGAAVPKTESRVPKEIKK